MKQLKLNVSTRDAIGTRNAKRLRAAGQIPAVVYGRSGSHHLSINDKELRCLLREIKGESALIKINDGNNDKLTILQKYVRDPVTDKFVHVDFHEISASEPINLSLPVHIEGESVGVKTEKGILQFLLHTIEVKALPEKIPAFIKVDITNLHVGESVYIKDLQVIEGLIYSGSPESVIIACSQPAAARSEKEETPIDGEVSSTEGDKTEDKENKEKSKS